MKISELIKVVKNNEELKDFFENNNVVIFNRYLKADIKEICELYGEKDDVVITYEVGEIQDNGIEKHFDLIIDIWTKESIEQGDEISNIIFKILNGKTNNNFFTNKCKQKYLMDEYYYRKNIKFSFVYFL